MSTTETDLEKPEVEAAAAEAAPSAHPTAGDGPDFALRVSPDQVSVLLDCADPLGDLERTLERIMSGFVELNLPEYPDRELTREILESAVAPGEHLVRHALIVGVAPTPPLPGRLEWSRDYFVEGWAVNERTDQMDFWEPLERRGVSAGEVVCRVLPPREGVPGLNVFGKEISVPTLKPVKLRLGKHVTEEEDGDGVRIVSAACDGRLRFANETVTVDDVYVIKGDVSLETGNIHHKGAVTVQGDVRAGALIETAGDVAVRGLVEASTIRCGGDLVVGGGIVGDGEGVVEAGGDVSALYISEARVSAGGDVTVKNEIAHADVDSRGRIRVDKGRIAGGHITAFKGIRVAEAGASGSTTTHLVSGVDPALEPALDVRREKLVELDAARERLDEALAKFESVPEAKAAALAQAKTDLHAKLDEVDAAKEKIRQEMERLRGEAAEAAVEEIVIYEEIWSGTTVQMGQQSMYVRASIHKPRLVRRDRKRLKLLPMGEGNTPDD